MRPKQQRRKPAQRNRQRHDSSLHSTPAKVRGKVVLHRIRDGDDLRSLASKYLRDSRRYLEIFELNSSVLRHPDVLPIGAEIKIVDERQ